MRVDKTVCDRCGFGWNNPTQNVGPATLKFRRPGDGVVSAVDVQKDLCIRCFDEVQEAVAQALKG